MRNNAKVSAQRPKNCRNHAKGANEAPFYFLMFSASSRKISDLAEPASMQHLLSNQYSKAHAGTYGRTGPEILRVSAEDTASPHDALGSRPASYKHYTSFVLLSRWNHPDDR